MDRVTITPIYTAGGSRALVEVEHIHADDNHVATNEIEDDGHGLPDAIDPTGFRFTVHECRWEGCGVRVATRLLHKLMLPELKGLVIEHEDGRIDMFGEVGDDWATNERQVIWG